MITSLYLPHDADQDKVETVKSEMTKIGAPTIRVVDCGDFYMALEGCHRLTAAMELGIAPVLTILEQDDMVDADSLDIDYLQSGESYAAGEIAGELRGMRNPVYTIGADGILND